MVQSIQVTTDKWVRNVGGAGPSYEAGVRSPTQDWATRAAASSGKWFSGVSAANAAGSYASGVRETGTPGWQSKTLAKLGRWSEGVSLGRAEFENAMRDVLAFEATLQQRILGLPDGTLQQRIQRATQWIEGMAKFT